jgi:hypothetical protein
MPGMPLFRPVDGALQTPARPLQSHGLQGDAEMKRTRSAYPNARDWKRPAVKRQGQGRIVAIASIGRRIGVPHLTPCCA